MKTYLNRLPRGVPQIVGYVIGMVLVAPLALFHVRIGALTFGINWTAALTFVGLSALLAVFFAWRGRKGAT